MDDDFGNFVVGILVALALLFFVAYILVILGVVFCLLAAVFGVGVGTNLLLRYLANQFDWRKIDERWIWLVIVVLVTVPGDAGLGALLIPPALAVVFGTTDLLAGWLAVLFYVIWLAGYLWAWRDPRFEHGMADVLISSTLISVRTKLQMWWEYNVVRRAIP